MRCQELDGIALPVLAVKGIDENQQVEITFLFRTESAFAPGSNVFLDTVPGIGIVRTAEHVQTGKGERPVPDQFLVFLDTVKGTGVGTGKDLQFNLCPFGQLSTGDFPGDG